MKRHSFIAFFILLSFLSQAQQRNCGTMSHLENLHLQDVQLSDRMQQIEQFTQQWVAAHPNGSGARALVTIPVVVHVVYNTTSENISDAQVQSQITVLNRDYSKTNTDATSIPSVWQSIAANTDIQFCLATVDPNGAATTGITRTATSATSFSDNDNVKRSSSGGRDAWPASKYLNLWVCDLGNSILGYAQFPGGPAATDGVVCDYQAFGTTGSASAPFNRGRTATHEVGHWLNLYHIWGDDGSSCSGSDNVSDTPNQGDENYGCPSFPAVSCSNGPNGDMFMNYMDYTDDACMYMFTNGQKARMQALFATGGTRSSLLTSNGCGTGTTPTCGVPASLSATGITTTTATLNWGAVSGAASYNVRVKAVASATWTTYSNTTTSRSITGLAAGTQYEFQVQTVCSTATGSFSASTIFTTTSVTPSCGTPTGLNATAITTTTATLNWTALSGAVSYNVRVKAVASTTWTTANTSSTSRNVSALSAGTQYEFQVQAVCSAATGSFSASTVFTTTASGCSDVYENNNSNTTAPSIPVNAAIQAVIGSSTDVDWFKFTNTTTQPRIKVTLTNLPYDYDIALYNSAGTRLRLSENANTTSETMIYNTSTVGTYYIRVYGYNGVFSTTSCYTLQAQISANSFREMADENINADKQSNGISKVYPNPATDVLMLDYYSAADAQVSYSVLNITGKTLLVEKEVVAEGANTLKINTSHLSPGIYMLRVTNGEKSEVKRFVIAE